MMGVIWLAVIVAAFIVAVVMAWKLWMAGTVVSAGIALAFALAMLFLLYAIYDAYWGWEGVGK